MSDLGDLGDFLKEGGVSNLDWFDVDENAYRELDKLPKQNLDIAPDLQAIWAHEDGQGPTNFVPNREGRPRTMGDLSEMHGLLRTRPEEIAKVARFALMQSDDLGHFRQTLLNRFDKTTLQMHRDVVASILAERGVLGRLYIVASDFSGCHAGARQPIDFVRRYANGARFVLAKPECANCIHNQKSPVGKDTCSVFHKEIQIGVPYTDSLAVEVEQMQRSKGKNVQLLAAGSPKDRIRLAMLASDAPIQGPAPLPKPKEDVSRLLRPVTEVPEVQPKVDLGPSRVTARELVGLALRKGSLHVADAQRLFVAIANEIDPARLDEIITKTAAIADVPVPTRTYQGMGEQPLAAKVPENVVTEQLIAASNLTRKRDENVRQMIAAEKAKPIVETLRREMLKGRSVDELNHVLRHSFQSTDLQATRDHWVPMYREAGLYGVLYSTQDSFDDCRQGSDFLAKHNAGIKAIVRGSKCDGCIYNKIGRCLLYGKPLIANANELVTWATAEGTLQDHKAAGRIQPWTPPSSEWGASPREALQRMHREAAFRGGPTQAQTRLDIVRAHHGAPTAQVWTSDLTKREIVKTASRYMNEGLYGPDLLAALKSRFDSRDLVATRDDLRVVLAEQGLQGIYFVDPSIYDDYGKGCDEAGRLHRSRLVHYAKLGPRCGSCVLQTRPGFCSKLNKALVVDPPYFDKAAQQRAILSSGPSTEVPFTDLINNGLSMMAEYDLQNRPMDIAIDPVRTAQNVDIEFGTGGQGVRI